MVPQREVLSWGNEKGPQNRHTLFVLLLTVGKGERYKERNTERKIQNDRVREKQTKKNICFNLFRWAE